MAPSVTEPTTPEEAVKFLKEATNYFRNRPTGGEDRAHWANVYNAENCDKAVALIEQQDALVKYLSETWVDNRGVVWAPPTAWAYAMVCKALNRLRGYA